MELRLRRADRSTLLEGLLERLATERLGLIRQAARVDAQRGELERRVAAVEAPPSPAVDELAQTLLDEVRARLDAGLSDEQRQEIVRLLVGIWIDTTLPTDGGKKSAKAVVEYRFPGVVETSTGRGSSRR